MKKVFLDELPRKIKGKNIDWNKSIGHKVKFIYDDIEDKVEIVNYYKKDNKYYLDIKYNENIMSLSINHFPKCKIGKLLNKKSSDYKYNINDIVINNASSIKITKHFRIKNKNGTTKKGYKYICLNCNNIDVIAEAELSKGGGCNVCCKPSKKVLKGYNDLWTTHPKVAKLLKYTKEGYGLCYGTDKQPIFICPNCGYEKSIRVHVVVNRGFPCPRCGDGISYPNKFVRSFLDQLNEEYIPEYSPDWAFIKHDNPKLNGKKKYDNYLSNRNEVWEVHGLQHYEEGFKDLIKGARTLKEEQENDKIKKELAEKNGLKYIVVDARNSEMDWIKNNLSCLLETQRYDLLLVNWLKCHEFACNSNLVKIACDHWNIKRNIIEISKIMNLAKNTIRKYLKQGEKLNWCVYKKNRIIKQKMIKKKTPKKIIQLDLKGEFIKEWDSIKDAQKELSIKNIKLCCNNIRQSSGGYMWVYKEDYKDNNIKPYIRISSHQRKIVQMNLNGDLIREWDSIIEAEKKLNIYGISNCCQGKHKTIGNYRWMYKEDYYTNINNIYPLENKDIHIKNKIIIQLDLNSKFIKKWNSVAEASKNLNISSKNISTCCTGKRKSAGGFKWIHKEDWNKKISR